MRRGSSVIERIMARIEIDPAGCWIWPGATVCGYGRLRITGDPKAKVLTHRATYEHFVGPIPAGMEIDHTCKVPACCNPLHLEPVTHAQNMARGAHATKTHCKNGHELAGDNLYFNRNRPTARICKTCTNDAQARYRARKLT